MRAMFWNPSGSRPVRENVCPFPAGLDGEMATTLGGRFRFTGIHMPVCTQPVSFPSLSFTENQIFCGVVAQVPTRLISTYSVRSVPVPPGTLEPPLISAH